MDLKWFAGKEVAIQFKPGHAWCVHHATESGSPGVTMRKANGGNEPVLMPLVQGVAQEDGSLKIETGNGGEISVMFDPDCIFSAVVIIKRPSSLVTPTPPRVVMS